MNCDIRVIILLLYITMSLQDNSKSQKLLLSSSKTDVSLENDLQRIRTFNDVQAIFTYMSSIKNSNTITCQSKVKLVEQIIKALQIKKSNNEQQIQSLNHQKPNDKLKMRDGFLKMKKQIQSSAVPSSIKTKEIEKSVAESNVKEQTRILNQYLNRLRQMKKGNSGKDESKNEAVERLEDQMKKLDLLIDQVNQKRKMVNKNLTTLRIKQLQQNQISVLDPDQIQKKYKQYSELAIQSLRKFKDKEDEINKLSTKLKSISGSPTTVDKQIENAQKQLNELKNDKNVKATSESSNITEVLMVQSDSLEGKIQALLKQCPN